MVEKVLLKKLVRKDDVGDERVWWREFCEDDD